MKRLVCLINLMVGGFLILLTVNGCKSPKAVSRSESVSTDSVSYIEKVTPIQVTVPGQKIGFNFPPLELDPETKEVKPVEYNSKSGQAGINLKIDKNGITGECTCDEYKADINTKEKEITRLKKEAQTKSDRQIIYVPGKTVKVPGEKVQYVAWYDKAARWISLIVIIFLIYIITKKLRAWHQLKNK